MGLSSFAHEVIHIMATLAASIAVTKQFFVLIIVIVFYCLSVTVVVCDIFCCMKFLFASILMLFTQPSG